VAKIVQPPNRAQRLAVLVLLAGCAARQPAPPPATPEAVEEFEAFSTWLRANHLARERVPGLLLNSVAPQTQERDGVRVTVAPVSAERQAWNAWPDGTARFFNDAGGYLWTIHVESDAPVRWDPRATALAVNDTDTVFTAAVGPEEMLHPILQAAAHESLSGAGGDYGLRLRNAEDFRRAYLPTRELPGVADGVVFFPAPAFRLQALALELRLAFVVDGGGSREFRFLFE
jgi:hypothetical protein